MGYDDIAARDASLFGDDDEPPTLRSGGSLLASGIDFDDAILTW